MLGALFAFGAVFCTMVLWYAPGFEQRFGLPIIDLSGFNPADRRLALIDGYGERGRSAYLWFLAIDCVFPVAASMLTWAGLRLLGVWQRLSDVAMSRLVWPPVVAASADLLENVCHAWLIWAHPGAPVWAAQLASGFTALKYAALWTAQLLAVVLIARGVVVALHRRARRGSASQISASES